MSKNKKPKKYYAVGSGRRLGIFGTWRECKALVDGYSNARFKSFLVRADAVEWLSKGAGTPNLGKLKLSKPAKKKKVTINSGHPDDMRGFADDSHTPTKPMIGGLYFELQCDCLPWEGCMKCVPIVEVRWGMALVIEGQNIGPRQMEIGYI